MTVNGTGPYRLEPGTAAPTSAWPATMTYWGTAARNERLILRWDDDAAGASASFGLARSTGPTTLGRAGLDAVADDVELKAVPRAGLNVFYVGFNNTFAPFDKVKVRLADRAGHRPRADRRSALPAGLRGGDPLLAVRHPVRLHG